MYNKNRIFSLFILPFALALFCVFCATDANAKVYYETKTSPQERAVFAFFRAADSAPNYDYWIKSSSRYKDLLQSKQNNYLLKETLRLGYGYGDYNQDNDLLEITTNVLVKYISAEGEEQPRIIFKFFDQSDAYVPSFNYSYANDIISMVINNLAGFSNIPLTQELSESLLSKIPFKDDFFDAVLTVHVRVSKADIDKPIENEDFRQWVMVGDIAYLKCDMSPRYASEISVLWDYVAPWYEESFRIKNMPEEEKYPHPYDLFKD